MLAQLTKANLQRNTRGTEPLAIWKADSALLFWGSTLRPYPAANRFSHSAFLGRTRWRGADSITTRARPRICEILDPRYTCCLGRSCLATLRPPLYSTSSLGIP